MRKTSIILILLLISMLTLLSACSGGQDTKAEIDMVKKLNENISEELRIYTDQVDDLASQLEELYALSDEEKAKLISKVDIENYKISKSGVLYKQDISEGSAVFVSGYIPVDDKIKNIVYFTEEIDLTFKTIFENYPEIAQVYYNDEFSYNRIYPSFDVLTQYQPKMNIPDFNFYYLADSVNNPNREAVWVKEPYVDPAGRGWMISAIAPVYSGEHLYGVAGLDLTINDITEKYLHSEYLFMITSDGTVVTISEKISTLLSLPVLKNHRYIETIKSDSYMVDEFNLMKSKNEEVRDFADKIVNSSDESFDITIDNVNYKIYKSKIEDLDWFVIKMLQAK